MGDGVPKGDVPGVFHVGKPHLVILGAGASRAAFPNGIDGHPMPVMNDLVATLELGHELDQAGIHHEGEDFESIYSRVASDIGLSQLRGQLEDRIYDYFRMLSLPPEPTMYDHLLLSLRPKDVVATFNWDPLIWRAAERVSRIARPPRLLFLHGNTAIGYCSEHGRKGGIGYRCGVCQNPFRASQLLYPILKKDYSADSAIASEWKDMRTAMADAYLVTVFGYSAPTADADAMAILKQAWGNSSDHQLEEFEFIDLVDKRILETRWRGFIYDRNFRNTNDFKLSVMSRHPRRTADSVWAQLMEQQPFEEDPIPEHSSWDELKMHLRPYLDREKERD